MTIKTITAKEYLNKKEIGFWEVGNGEIKTHCLFNGCDDDSKGDEAHLYIEDENGLYNCKKCGAKGNLITLAKHLGDDIKDIAINGSKAWKRQSSKKEKLTAELVESRHKTLPGDIREYLNKRGIPDKLINNYKLGWGEFYGKYWITIPIKNKEGNYALLKLRRQPSEDKLEDKNDN